MIENMVSVLVPQTEKEKYDIFSLCKSRKDKGRQKKLFGSASILKVIWVLAFAGDQEDMWGILCELLW